MLPVEDEGAREGLAVAVGRSARGPGKVVLAALVEEQGAPGYIRPDNGPEFVARDLTGWQQGVQAHTAPGCPWPSAYGESGSAALRRECLNQELFHRVLDAREKTGLWRLWQKTAAAQRVGVPNA